MTATFSYGRISEERRRRFVQLFERAADVEGLPEGYPLPHAPYD